MIIALVWLPLFAAAAPGRVVNRVFAPVVRRADSTLDVDRQSLYQRGRRYSVEKHLLRRGRELTAMHPEGESLVIFPEGARLRVFTSPSLLERLLGRARAPDEELLVAPGGVIGMLRGGTARLELLDEGPVSIIWVATNFGRARPYSKRSRAAPVQEILDGFARGRTAFREAMVFNGDSLRASAVALSGRAAWDGPYLWDSLWIVYSPEGELWSDLSVSDGRGVPLARWDVVIVLAGWEPGMGLRSRGDRPFTALRVEFWNHPGSKIWGR